jgi:hypothetical protein
MCPSAYRALQACRLPTHRAPHNFPIPHSAASSIAAELIAHAVWNSCLWYADGWILIRYLLSNKTTFHTPWSFREQKALWVATILGGKVRKVMCVVTYLRSWALLEKLPIVQPFKNFPAFYGTRRFITVFTRALHWSPSYLRYNLYALLTSQVPNLISIFFSLGRLSKESVQVRGFLWILVKSLIFTVRSC